MSKTDASVAFSVTDNLSQSIVGMKNSVTQFRKELSSTQKELHTLDSQKYQLKNFDLRKAREELKAAEKEFKKLGDSAAEADRKTAADNLEKATQKYDGLRRHLESVSRQAREAERYILDLETSLSKADNRADRSGGAGILSGLGQAGILSMAGGAAGQWADAIVGSALGGDAGGMASSALSGAASGAAMGSLLGGPGIAVGAALGGALGLAGGAAQSFQNRDAAFKDYYGGLYDTAAQGTAESLAGGSATAGQRELDAIAFDRLLGEGAGDQYLEDLRVMAAATPMEYGDLTGMSRALATGFGDSPERMLELMEAIGDAGSAVGVTASDMTEMARAMSRMQSSGKASLEFLNIFQDRGVDAIGMLGEAMGKTQGEIYDMISKGEINGRDAASILQAGMEESYSGAMEVMARTFDGLTSTLSDAMTEIDNAMGEGYNATRNTGLQAEIDAYGGALGGVLSNLNGIIGENKAYLENLGEQYQREALSAVFLGEDTTVYKPEDAAKLKGWGAEYRAASFEYEQTGSRDAALTMERLKEEAEALATATYESSDQYQAVVDAQLDSIEAIRENTAGLEAATNAYRIAQELGKGGFDVPDGVDTGSIVVSGLNPRWRSGSPPASPHAFGLDRVPYDGYAALLHEGERVLTAREARAEDRDGAGEGGGIALHIDTINVGGGATEEDARRVARIIADALDLRQKSGAFQRTGT